MVHRRKNKLLTPEFRKYTIIFLIVLLYSAAVPLHAQTETDTVSSSDKAGSSKGVGVLGGLVAGAEVVLVTESIIRVKPLWPWIVLPAVGAVGGGFGGYYLQKKTRGGAIALLITAMVGIIPTAIGVSSGRSFHPEDEGAKEGDDQQFFEPIPIKIAPSTESRVETVTEVERPDGVPTDTVGPPSPPEQPYSPAETPKTPPTPPVEPTNGDPTSSIPWSPKNHERVAHLSSGALVHLNRRLHLGLGIPAVDVFPVSLPHPHTQARQSGLEIQVPLFRFDLP